MLLALMTAVLVGTNLWLAVRAYDAEWSQVTSTSKNLGHSVATQLDSIFNEAERVLGTMGYMAESAEFSQQALDALQPVMVNYVSRNDYFNGLFVYGADGSWLVHTQSAQGPISNNSDREYFQVHRSSRSERILIGRPITSRSTGEWVIPVSRRLNDANGEFAGVALATVKVTSILKLLNSFDVGAKGAISLSLIDGTIVVRRPFSVDDLGRRVSDNPLLRLVANARSGSLLLASPIDAVERLVVFEHLADSPLFVTVAVAKEEVLQQWRRSTEVQFLCVTLLIAVIGSAGWYVVHALTLRRASDHALAQAHVQLMQANEQLAHMADHDALTELPNRRAFDRRLLEFMGHCKRHNRPVTLLMFDVDFFKQYNDEYGHPAGDECLRIVGAALRAAMRRPGDFVARYGGEEFAAVLLETDTPGAALVASAARSQVLQLQLRHAKGIDGVVTVSCGLASTSCKSGGETPADLLKRADAALYAAKQGGRNRVEAAPDVQDVELQHSSGASRESL
ncbi:sensor domain-containing diguanylate cyclase [Acidovorax sp. PRC11]|uniref:sensor domain-containing diguanylate cyclase n=1 Tax=Acidovorax sp. PRC11 TaxID=2962592 RepID=UPI0028812537|nr:sensor domain-containing diguanylate cyclase [Acidovorax sp. PRC11]MDT0138098.1 sensor domain-containing diguanylate cyclase [Acidovorax sp. PRC11]